MLRDYGYADARPVFCEDFWQWVIEDRFPLGRPPLEAVGVQFTADVAPWELMKLRILNGGHAAIAYASALMDVAFVHEAMAEPLIAGFLEKLTREEIIPVTPAPEGVSLEAYRAEVARRFANPAIADTTRRLCHDGANRQPKFILPAIRDRLAAGAPVEGLALATALWRRYCAGVTDGGRSVEPNEGAWAELQARARNADPADWIAMGAVYGDLGAAPPFAEAFVRAAERVERLGAAGAVRAYLDA
jgi:mannitol 2-dehydrogenase